MIRPFFVAQSVLAMFLSYVGHQKVHELLWHLPTSVVEQTFSAASLCSDGPGGGAILIINIPSRSIDCGVQPPGNVETITSYFLYRVSKKSVDLLLLPLCGRPSGSHNAQGRGMKYDPR
jgi:hypothetical protein